MRTMTWEEIDKDWFGLQKRHRGEIAAAVVRYCVGHDIKEVARRLGYSPKWVRNNLDHAGVAIGVGGDTCPPLTAAPDGKVSHDIPQVIQAFAPSEEEEQSEAFEPYVAHYKEQGHSDDIAKRLARAEWAGEAAVEAGVIKESKNKRDEKVNRILFPTDDKDTFELRLREHMARVEAAARFLDEAKVPFLKRKSTCKKVAAANAKWLEQVERIRNLHPTFDEVL